MKTLIFIILILTNSAYAASKIPTWGQQAINVKGAWDIAGAAAQGKGAKILNIDTGVDTSVKLIGRFFKQGKSMRIAPVLGLPYDYYDESGHGTAIAGILAGIAPKSELYVARIDQGVTLQDVITDIQKAVEWGKATKVQVINIELALTNEELKDLDTRSLDQSLRSAFEQGIVIVAPSGNNDVPTMSYPANSPWVLSVGEVDIFNQRNFGQYGPILAVVAPGESITTSYPVGKARDAQVEFNFGTSKLSVKSMGYVRSPFVKRFYGSVMLAGMGTKDDFNNFESSSLALVKRAPRKIISVQSQIENALRANASGLLICNSEPILSTKFASLKDPETKVPVVYLDRFRCEAVWKTLDQGQAAKVKLQITPGNLVSFSGTSGSSAFVAGTAALMYAAAPRIRPVAVMKFLQQTATPISSTKHEYGSGLINAAKAVKRAMDLE